MDKEIQKKISRNWFKILQDIFCNEIENLENNKISNCKYLDKDQNMFV